MAWYKNTKPSYGDEGPFEADSKEALADEMAPTFDAWVYERAQAGEDRLTAREAIREEFIDGLEECPKITIKQQEGWYPLYHRYYGQYNAQDAFVELDLREGTLCADYQAGIGNGIPFVVHHGLVHRFAIPATMPAEQINDLLEEIKPWAGEVVKGFEDRWDGSNWVGQLTDEAYEAVETIDNMCREVDCCDILVVTHWSEWFQDSSEIIAALEWGNSFEEMEKEARGDVEADGHIFDITTDDFKEYVIAQAVEVIEEFSMLSDVEKAVDEWNEEVLEEDEIREALRTAVQNYLDNNLS